MLSLSAFIVLSLAACPQDFDAGSPPCSSHADCSPKVLGEAFSEALYLCLDGRCEPPAVWDGSFALPDAAGSVVSDVGPGRDLGPAVDAQAPIIDTGWVVIPDAFIIDDPDGGGGLCGNGRIDPGEACDDGNIVDGDGCSAICESEAARCGNGIVEEGEACDDGNDVAGDGCNPACELEEEAVATICDLHAADLFVSCAGCHTGAEPSGELNIDNRSPETLFRSLLWDAQDIPVISPSGAQFIAPGFPNDSLLYRKVAGTHLDPAYIERFPAVGGARMPLDQAPWSEDQMLQFVQFIERDVAEFGVCFQP
jgi:cysteine-rich repeat protein